MNIRQARFTFNSVTAALALTAAGTIASGWLWPYESFEPAEAGPIGSANGPEQTPSRSLPSLSSFKKVWELDLRQSRDGQPAPVTTTTRRVKSAPARLSAKLAGTVLERGHSVAMFVTKGGKIEIKKIGETIGGAEVLDITQEGVSLRHRGKTVRLFLERRNRL